VAHDHTESGYNDRPAQCREVVSQLRSLGIELSSLRDLTMDQLKAHQGDIEPVLYNRAVFILQENERVLEFIKALEDRDMTLLGKLLYQSHEGLQHLYEVSCAELDLLVDLTRHDDAVIGSRMMGGGFGGCTLNLIKSSEADRVVDEITTAYKKKTNIEPSVYRVMLSDGVNVLD